MRTVLLSLCITSTIMAGNFTLQSDDIKGQLTKTQEFNAFGCSGENKSPELHWSQAPKGTKSFALTIYDPDAPTGSGWWHWIVVNIPAKTTHIPSNASALKTLPKHAIETMTDFGTASFGGACPPRGDKAHGYIVTLYALDTDKLDVSAKSDSALVGYMIHSHTIEKTSLISYYQRDKEK